MPELQALPSEAIRTSLTSLPEWTYEESANAIVRTFRFPNYLRGIEFVNAVAHLAERQNHHPDIDVRYREVRISYWTHVANGVTSLDFDGAKEVDTLFGQFSKISLSTGS